MEYKFVFVILHFITIEETKKCVNSILQQCNGYNFEIVIVDNASSNNSGYQLKELYLNDKRIHVIINKINLGFAKGNNVGFKYAKEDLNADFIIMCNNDTYLLQNDFLDLVSREFETSNFAVLGPKIKLPNDKINNVVCKISGIKESKKHLLNMRINYIVNFLYLDKVYNLLKKILKRTLIKLKLYNKQKKIDENVDIRYENIVLHGSFLTFSKIYIERFDGLDDRTFLYREEELLALRLKKSGLKSVYNPKIEIYHNEDSATNAITTNSRKKQIFICKNQIKSTKILLKELKNGGM